MNSGTKGLVGYSVTPDGVRTLTNKTIDLTYNTLTGTTAQFNTALSNGDFATQAGSEVLTNKTIALGSNTVSGTTAQFNTALSDGDFVTLAGSEVLTNKTLTSPTLTTPVLGTPSSGTLSSCTGLPLTTGVTGTLPLGNGGTGVASGAHVYVITSATVNMNAVADTALTIPLPTGFTRYRVQALIISHASVDLTAATTVHYGLFTSTGGGGTAVVADTTSTVSSASESTTNNAQFISPSITASLNNATLQFRVITAHGSAATADVALQIQPLL